MTEATIYIERDGEELELTITGYCTRFIPAIITAHPETSSPAECGESEVEEIFCGGEPWTGTLTEKETHQAEKALHEQAAQDNEVAAEDAAVAKYEARRDR